MNSITELRAGTDPMEKEQLFRTAGEWIEGNKDAIAGLNDLIWDYGEPGFCETKSAAALCELLSENGFAVKTGIANMPTAFVGDFGNRPTAHRRDVRIRCDAWRAPGRRSLPHPDPDRSSGFTDLHNGIGVASAAAAVAIAKAMQAHGVDGSVDRFWYSGREALRRKAVHGARRGFRRSRRGRRVASAPLLDCRVGPRSGHAARRDLRFPRQERLFGAALDRHQRARRGDPDERHHAVHARAPAARRPRDDHRNDLPRRRAPDLHPRPCADLVHPPGNDARRHRAHLRRP